MARKRLKRLMRGERLLIRLDPAAWSAAIGAPDEW